MPLTTPAKTRRSAARSSRAPFPSAPAPTPLPAARDTMVISRAPVRVSFLGGGSDFPAHFREHGGAVLTTAINRYAYVTAQPFLQEYFDHKIRLAYRRSEAVNTTAEIQHPAIRAALEKLGIDSGIEMHVMADLPARTGLGSSSSFVVAMLQALHAHSGRFRCARDLADEAITLERNILGEAGGWQDQVIAAHGGLSLITFERSGTYNVRQLSLAADRIQDLERHMLLVYTQIQRDSATVQKQLVVGAAAKAKVLARMADLAHLGADYLTSNMPIARFGELLHAGWELKKESGSVTLPEIDAWYEAGLRAGATGGKLLGAGQGGFLLFIAEPRFHANIQKALGNRPTVQVQVNAPGAQIIFSQR